LERRLSVQVEAEAQSKLAAPPPDPGDASLARIAARGGAWATLASAVNKVLTAVATIIVAQRLTPGDYGLAGLVGSLGMAVIVVVPMSMTDVLVAHQSKFGSLALPARRTMTVAGTFMAAAFIGSVPLAAWVYSEYPVESLAPLMALVALRLLADSWSAVSLAKLRIELSNKPIAIIDGTTQAAATALMVAMAVAECGAVSIILPLSACSAARALLYRFVAGPVRESRPRRTLFVVLVRTFALSSVGQYLHNAVFVSETVVLGWLSSADELGTFSFAFLLASQANSVIAFQLGNILQPLLGRMAKDPERQAHAFLRAISAIGAVAVPVAAIQAACASTAFDLVFDQKWSGALPLFVILSAAQGFFFVVTPTMAMLKSRHMFGRYVAWQLIQLLVSFAVYGVAASHWGALGVAIGSTAIWSISAILGCCVAVSGARVLFSTILRVFLLPWVLSAPLAVALYLGLNLAAGLGWSARLCLMVAGASIALVTAFTCTRWVNPAAWRDLAPLRGFVGALVVRWTRTGAR
jgi:O-antigen/teichoic acid export membrane protein